MELSHQKDVGETRPLKNVYTNFTYIDSDFIFKFSQIFKPNPGTKKIVYTNTYIYCLGSRSKSFHRNLFTILN